VTTYASFSTTKIQLGREATAGTAVPATAIWRGSFSHIKDSSARTQVEEQIGLLVQAERSYQANVGGTLVMPSTPLTFEQILHLYEAGIQTVTPTGTTDKTYLYAFPTSTTVNTIKTYTVQSGSVLAPADNLQMKYSFVDSMTFSAAPSEAWTMEASWMGHQPTLTAMTGSLAAAPVEEALSPKTKLYIDATGGTVGATQKLGVFMGAQIQINTGVRPVPVGDGSLSFAAHKFVKPEITFSITMELEQQGGSSLVATERAIQTAGTPRLLKISVDGTSNRNLFWEFAGVYDEIGDYENSDGNTNVTFSGHAVYSAADALFFRTSVTNKLASVP
jgi:hypothetical protein